MNNNDCATSSDVHLCPASPDGQEIFRRSFDNSDVSPGNFPPAVKYHQQNNPKKKRTKMIRIDNSKPKYGKKPDPSAPKITRPCSECGRKFWSWKALFGHMRCHPERQWRGINPPPNLRRSPACDGGLDIRMTEEDRHVAMCLLMLANGSTRTGSDTVATTTATTTTTTAGGGLSDSETGFRDVGIRLVDSDGSGHPGLDCSRFECSNCKKVFGSHQALGGHRASHKNVKGCFANTRNEGGEEESLEEAEGGGHDFVGDIRNGEVLGEAEDNIGNNNNMTMVLGTHAHKCSICLRVFSSGQALGGHKRCHWEKGEVVPAASATVLSIVPYGFDLNLPAPIEEDDDDDSSSTTLALDLRLGL